jgi:hypothetical protein
MTTVTVSSHVEAPVSQVFKHFTNVEHAAERVAGIHGVEMMTPGPFGPGTKWREIREVMGRMDSAEMEVTSYDKDRMYTITHYKAHSRIDTVFSFEPEKDGTKVTIEFTLAGQGMPPGLMAPLAWLASGKIRNTLIQDLEDLKGSIDQQ